MVFINDFLHQLDKLTKEKTTTNKGNCCTTSNFTYNRRKRPVLSPYKQGHAVRHL